MRKIYLLFLCFAFLGLNNIAYSQCAYSTSATVYGTGPAPTTSCTVVSAYSTGTTPGCHYTTASGDLAAFTGLVAGNSYTIFSSATSGSTTPNTDFLTVYLTPATAASTAVAYGGGGTLTFTAPSSGTYHVVIATSSTTCTTTQSTCRYLSIQCNSCTAPVAAVATTQPATTAVAQGTANVQVLRVNLTNLCGSSLSSVNFTLGTTTAAADITKARVYYTTTTTFATTTQFGTDVVNPSGSFSVTGSQALSNGAGYLWLVYDVACGATLANVVDGELTSATLTSGTISPTTTNPTGTRAISALSFAPVRADGNATTAVAGGTTNATFARLNLTGTGSCINNVTQVDFAVSGTSPATDVLRAKCYYTTTTTFSSAVPFGSVISNPAAGTITFSGTQALAAGTGNYFWLVYDLPCSPVVGNTLNGDVTAVTVGGNVLSGATITGTATAANAIAAGGYSTAADGDWSSPSTWACGIPPSNSSSVTINNNVTVSTAGIIAGNVTINSGKSLTINSGGDLTIGTNGGGKNTLANNGSLTVSGGLLTVNGNVLIANAANFTQTGGTIKVDGNAAGVVANSVATGTAIFAIGTSATNYSTGTISLTGGTLQIVDPHAGTSQAFIYYGAATPVNNITTGINHTFQFGDGVSTDAGGSANGFIFNQWEINGGFKPNLVINTAAGINRVVTSTYTPFVVQNLTILNGEFLTPTNTYIEKSLTVNAPGILTATGTIVLATGIFDGSSLPQTASANAQTISGTGTFRNLATAATANLTSFTINNSSVAGVTLATPLVMSGTLTLTAGVLNTTAPNLLTLGVLATPSAGTLTYTAGQIAGPFKRVVTAATGTYALPVGTTATYIPASINFTTAPTTAGTLTAEFKTTAPGGNGLPLTDGAVTIDAVAQTGYWSIVAGDGLTGGTYTVAITGTGFPGITTPAELRVIKRATSAAAWTVEGTHVAGSGVTASRSGLTTFSEFAIASAKTSNTLPVSILNFKGERVGLNNVLSWTTATEVNNAGFELQRSADGTNFSQLAFVNSKSINGNSSTVTNYELTDTKALIAGSYYRLKQLDKDGKSTLSQVVFIKGTKPSKLELVSVYPNPAVNTLNVSMVSPKADNITFIVSDVAGKVVVKQAASVSNGDNNIKVNVSNLAKGTYTIKAICVDGCETAISKFVKQ